MNPRGVLFQHEFYRMISSAFFHGNLMHIGMNMLSYMTLGKSLEKKFGTVFMTFTVANSVLLTSVIYILIALGTYTVGSEKLMNQNSLGFSGVLFHLLVLESKCRQNTSQSIFGMVQVSAKYYPWVMLVVIQFLMPNISFVGHLSGILCGTLQSCGYLSFTMPSIEYLRTIDESERFRRINSMPSYIKTPVNNDEFSLFSDASGMGVPSCFSHVFTFVRNVIETVRFIIFGRADDDESAEQGVALNEGEWIGIPSRPFIDQSRSEMA